MLKKTVSSLMLALTLSPIAVSVLPNRIVSADTSNSTNVMKPQPRELHARFSGELHEGMGVQPVNLGTVENTVPPFVMLDVVDGGPKNLSWSASIVNMNTGQTVSDWKEFNHSYGSLTLNLNKNKVRVGDQLQLQLHANSGSGNITLVAG